MDYKDTEAFHCRYGDIAGRILEGADILWESSLANDQGEGYAHIFARLPNNTSYCFLSWEYGSCEGCDAWMDSHATDAEIQADMISDGTFFQSRDEAKKWLNYFISNNAFPAFYYNDSNAWKTIYRLLEEEEARESDFSGLKDWWD